MPISLANRPAPSPPEPRVYSRAERLSDAALHVTGLGAALAAVPVLVVLAALLRGDAPSIVGTSVYGVTLLAMILCSALFNMIARPDWAWLLQRLDHAAIYLKIAGTYTPFALMTGEGGGLALAIWAAAAVGVGARRSAAKSASVTSVSCPTPHTTGKPEAAIARTTRSSLNDHRSSSDPPPRHTISKSTSRR